MRIPTSTIVMSLVTCVPFGLAIRDTLTNHDQSFAAISDDTGAIDPWRSHLDNQHPDMDEAPPEPPAPPPSLDPRELQRATASIVGSKPGELGTFFDGISLGTPLTKIPDRVGERIGEMRVSSNVRIQLQDRNGALASVEISPQGSEPLCEALLPNFELAWGASTDAGSGVQIWESATSGQRVTLTMDPCQASFEQFVPLDKWLSMEKDSIVPFSEVGKPSPRAPVAIGGSQASSSRWAGPGIAGGHRDTVLDGSFDHGTLTDVTAVVDIPPNVQQVLVNALTKRYGKPTSNEDGILVWNSKPPIALEMQADSLRLQIGIPIIR